MSRRVLADVAFAVVLVVSFVIVLTRGHVLYWIGVL